MNTFDKFDARAWAQDWIDRKPLQITTDLEVLSGLLELAHADGKLEACKELKALYESRNEQA